MRTDAGLVFLPYFRNESAVFNVRTIAVPSFGRVVGKPETDISLPIGRPVVAHSAQPR